MKCTSILNKVLMAITGAGLVGFLISHLAGNLKLYAGQDDFNKYAKFLEDLGPLLIVAELGLLAIFIIHIATAIKLTLANRAARPVGYEQKTTAGQSTLASRTMIISGIVILIFVIFHVKGMKFGTRPNDSLFQLVIEKFSDPGIAAFYVVCMLFMGLHLSHGIASLFQSLGLRDASGHPRLGGFGAVIGWVLALGFASFPLWVFVAKPAVKPVPAVKAAVEIPAVKKTSAE